ncbi:hypothetical protein V6N12_002819 [Hibiscus sabdariffa]|uniref:Uncharacterized protein n=1 Tax=Hibiscus sabdariffa TaxID=183260 RepID=A0ABR2EA35_9ROSI
MESDEALVVKGTLITVARWRQLTRVESKDKGKGKVSEPTPKSKATKFVLVTAMLASSMTLLSKVIQNQEDILHKLARLES